jgi:rfaE bifunctional protein kinase chain/domain
VLAGGVHTRRQQIVRIDRGGRETLPRQVSSALGAALRRALKRVDGVLIADYGYGAATPEGTTALMARLGHRGIPVTVDSRSRVAQFRGAAACTPNQEEVERALNLAPPADEAAVEAAGRKLLRRTGSQAVLMTRGADGMSLFRRRIKPEHIPAYGSDEVADVTGAGDTVIAVFTLALLSGADFADAARLSNYAAGLVVMKAGTATISPAELTQAIGDDLDGGKGR